MSRCCSFAQLSEVLPAPPSTWPSKHVAPGPGTESFLNPAQHQKGSNSLQFVSLFPLSATDLAVQASASPRLYVWNWLFGAEDSVGWVWWVPSTGE